MKFFLQLVFLFLFAWQPLAQAWLNGSQYLNGDRFIENQKWILFTVKADHTLEATPLLDTDKANISRVGEPPKESPLGYIIPYLAPGDRILVDIPDGDMAWNNNWIVLPAFSGVNLKELRFDQSGIISLFKQNILDLSSSKNVSYNIEAAKFILDQAIQSLLLFRVPRTEILDVLLQNRGHYPPDLNFTISNYRISLGDVDEIFKRINPSTTGGKLELNPKEIGVVSNGLSFPLNRKLTENEVSILWSSGNVPIKKAVLSQLDSQDGLMGLSFLREALLGDQADLQYAAVSACSRIFGNDALRRPSLKKFSKDRNAYLQKSLSLIERISR